jgi:hypothetical protein
MITKINPSVCKRILFSGQMQSVLKSATTKEQLVAKAFDVVGRHQKAMGYDVLAVRAEMPDDPKKGEVELTVQVGSIGDPRQNKMYEVTFSRRVQKFTIDEQSPTLL